MTPTTIRTATQEIACHYGVEPSLVFDILNKHSVEHMCGARSAPLILKFLGIPEEPRLLNGVGAIIDLVEMSGDLLNDEKILEAVSFKWGQYDNPS